MTLLPRAPSPTEWIAIVLVTLSGFIGIAVATLDLPLARLRWLLGAILVMIIAILIASVANL